MVTFNVTGVDLLDKIKAKLISLKTDEKDKMLRYVASSLAPFILRRIHKDGKKADGSLIGPKGYSNAYLKLRKKYNRTEGNKVVSSLTGEMEKDFSIGITDPIKTPNGYGLGFKNAFNAQKADWLENGHDSAEVKAHERNYTRYSKVKTKVVTIDGKVRTRTKTKATTSKIKVRAHNRMGWVGYGGGIWDLSESEKKQSIEAAKSFIKKLL